MIPLWMTVHVRTGSRRGLAVHLPLVVLWLVMLPWAVLLAPWGMVWCWRRRVHPLHAARALWAVLAAGHGTVVEIEHSGAAVRVRIGRTRVMTDTGRST